MCATPGLSGVGTGEATTRARLLPQGAPGLVRKMDVLHAVTSAVSGDIRGAGPGCERASWKKRPPR